MQEMMERPERRRREGRRSVRFAFGRRSSLFCVSVLFLYLYFLWVSVFFGFNVGPAKLQRGATLPSVMVLFWFCQFKSSNFRSTERYPHSRNLMPSRITLSCQKSLRVLIHNYCLLFSSRLCCDPQTTTQPTQRRNTKEHWNSEV